MKKILSLILACLLVVGMVPTALAEDDTIYVSTLAELKEAIENAPDDATIQIMQTIEVNGYDQIGMPDKHITLCASEMTGTLLYFTGGDGNSACLSNVTIDGAGSANEAKVIVETFSEVSFDGVIWKNCSGLHYGGGLNVTSGGAKLNNCSFYSCSSENGAGVYVAWGAYAKFIGCTFSDNIATSMGGAIAAPGSIEVTDCTFSSNQATNSGGAVSGENMTFTRCQFNENASQIGGALYCFSGVTSAACSTFTGNTATDGGAIMIISDAEATLAEVTITDNFARESGGGLSTSGKTYLAEAKVYGNYADKCGSDLQASNSTTIYVEDYTSLYAEELSAGNYNAYGWYLDEEDARYSADSKTEMLSITDSSLSLDSASLIFVMWTESQPSTSDTPEDEDQAPSKDSDQDQGSNTDPTPSESTDSGPSIIYPPTRHPATTPTPSTGTQEDDEETPLLVCGKAVIDNAALAEFVAGIDQSNLCQKITRGKLAFILYSLLTSDSKDMLGDDRDNAYPDLRDSSYQAEINALTEAGIFCGDSNGNFLPESTLTYGQLLTVLARLAEGDGAVMSSLENSTHWAAPSAKIAYAHGWIDDIPIDLDSPVTYGALASILNRVLAT